MAQRLDHRHDHHHQGERLQPLHLREEQGETTSVDTPAEHEAARGRRQLGSLTGDGPTRLPRSNSAPPAQRRAGRSGLPHVHVDAARHHHVQLRLGDGSRESGSFGLATGVSGDGRLAVLGESLADGELTVPDGIQGQMDGAVALSDTYRAYGRGGPAMSAASRRAQNCDFSATSDIASHYAPRTQYATRTQYARGTQALAKTGCVAAAYESDEMGM